jgi:hypothetical protein
MHKQILGELFFYGKTWNGRLLHSEYPHLFSFAIEDNITLKYVLAQESLQDIFNLPMS